MLIGVVDDDVVDLSNLQRQVIHGVADIGTQKTDSAATAIAAINPNVEVVPHTLRLSSANIDSIVNQYDLILDGTDNFDTRYAINAACVGAEKPLVAAAIACSYSFFTVLKSFFRLKEAAHSARIK